MTEYRLAIKRRGKVYFPTFAPTEFYATCATLERARGLKRLYEADVTMNGEKVVIIDTNTNNEIM